MFGLDFLFAAALWALPLAGLPVLLHMLFRRRSPIVPFSTLRFIKASIQQTAARRRIQRWLLLACRVLLLLLLIGASAQPVRILASGWLGQGESAVAVIVVDTSYSMQLKQGQVRLLDAADDAVGQLLRGPLSASWVCVFRSLPADPVERLEPAATVLSQWTPLQPQPSPRPLADRCAAAIDLLARQPAGQKWLIVLSDMQSREFPQPLPVLADERVVLFDLHPEKPSSNGIASLRTEPQQPIPGVGTQVAVEVTGRSGDAPFVNIEIARPDRQKLKTLANQQATFESGGRSRLRVAMPEGLPLERWLVLSAQLQRDDDLDWDNRRTQLIELPPRQSVTFVVAPSQPAASHFLRLALDPWEGKEPAWPLEVHDAPDLTGREQAAVMILSDWPEPAEVRKLSDFAQGGGVLILFLQPGIETGLGETRRTATGGIADPVAGRADGHSRRRRDRFGGVPPCSSSPSRPASGRADRPGLPPRPAGGPAVRAPCRPQPIQRARPCCTCQGHPIRRRVLWDSCTGEKSLPGECLPFRRYPTVGI